MAIIKNVSFCEFIDAFTNMGRENQFSYKAKEALFQYYDNLDENYELDVIALCCEWSEYDDIDDYNEQLHTDYEDIEALSNDVFIIYFESGILVQN